MLRPWHAARGQRSAAPSPKPRASPQAPCEVQPGCDRPELARQCLPVPASACQCLPVGRTVCALHGNLAVAVDAAPASAAVEALDVSVRVAAVEGVEVAEAPQVGVTHHSHGGGARVGHLVGARARARAKARARASRARASRARASRARVQVGAKCWGWGSDSG